MESKEEAKESKPVAAAAEHNNPYHKSRGTPDYKPATINLNRSASGGRTPVNCRWFYGTVFESTLSFCAVRRVGDMVYSSGTMAVDEEANSVVSKDEPDLQTRYILKKLGAALREVGSCLADIVQVTAYTTDVSNTIQIGYEFAQVFKDIMPAVTLLPVPELVRDDCTVMIQVTAIIQPRNYPESEQDSEQD